MGTIGVSSCGLVRAHWVDDVSAGGFDDVDIDPTLRCCVSDEDFVAVVRSRCRGGPSCYASSC